MAARKKARKKTGLSKTQGEARVDRKADKRFDKALEPQDPKDKQSDQFIDRMMDESKPFRRRMVESGNLTRQASERISRAVAEVRQENSITFDRTPRSRHVGLNVPTEGTSNAEVVARRRKARRRNSRP